MFDPLTDHRREFLEKAVMDMVKLAAGAAFVSGFFGIYPLGLRILVLAGLSFFFGLAWILFPAKGAR